MSEKRKLVLVAMPWPPFDSASPALATLAAYIARECPDWTAECRSEYVSLWAIIQEEYERVLQDVLIAELIYAEKLYPEKRALVLQSISAYFAGKIERERKEGAFNGRQPIDSATLERLFHVTTSHLETTSEQIAAEYDVLGLSVSNVGQFFSSLCLAKRVKEINPRVFTVLGGPGVGSTGSALLEDRKSVV